jgi:nucleoside-diphosphate-sugar epimerase
MRALIIGCGYVGLPLGREMVCQGHEVYGMRRSGGNDLQPAGIHSVIGDITRPESLTTLRSGFDWVINTVSSSKGGVDDYRAVYLEGNRNVLAALSTSPPLKYVFTSSTSVYGQDDGSIVTEESATEPASPTSRILVEAENLLEQAHAESSFPSIIVRPSGIYGPGRGYLFRQYLKGEAQIVGKGDRSINMVHVDDMVGGIIAVLQHGQSGEIYNLSDDEPVRQVRFFEWLSQQLGRPMPPFVNKADAPKRKRGLTNKRVSNVKLKTQTGYEFRYPTFREGYEAEIREAREL